MNQLKLTVSLLPSLRVVTMPDNPNVLMYYSMNVYALSLAVVYCSTALKHYCCIVIMVLNTKSIIIFKSIKVVVICCYPNGITVGKINSAGWICFGKIKPKILSLQKRNASRCNIMRVPVDVICVKCLYLTGNEDGEMKKYIISCEGKLYQLWCARATPSNWNAVLDFFISSGRFCSS